MRAANGSTVVLQGRVERCLPANANAVDLVVALSGTERIAGIPETAFEYANVELVEADWKERVFVRYEGEALLSLRPDLVIAQGMQNPDTGRALARAGVPVLLLPDVRGIDDLVRSVRMLGEALEEEQAAEELVAEIERRRAALAGKGWTKTWSVVPYSNYGTGGWTAGIGTTAEMYVELAGLRNAVVEAGLKGHFQVDAERLFELDPDVILVHSSARDPQRSPSAELLRSDPVLKRLRAVQEGRIVALSPQLLSTSSQHVLTTAERLAEEVWRLLEEE